MRYFLFIFFFLIVGHIAFSQGEIDDQNKILFRNEKTYGLSLNSNGFGFGYRYAKRINIHRSMLFEGNFDNLKHEKEKKIYNPNSFEFFRFVYGKTNAAFDLHFGVGQHHEIYKKFDRNSVSIRWFYTGGISFAFLKPIYYYIYDDVSKQKEWKLFEKNTPYWYIHGKRNFFYGLNKIKLVPGVYVKTGFGFDFGKSDKKVNMIEAGILFEAYPKALKILETEKNPQFLPIFFLSYRFGKAESGYYLKKRDEENSGE